MVILVYVPILKWQAGSRTQGRKIIEQSKEEVRSESSTKNTDPNDLEDGSW